MAVSLHSHDSTSCLEPAAAYKPTSPNAKPDSYDKAASYAPVDLAGANDAQASLRTVAFQGAAIMIAFAIPTIAAMVLDTRQLNDVSVWDKPLKFELSLAIHLFTLAVLSQLFTGKAGASRLIRGAYLTSVVASFGEIAYIVLQAARGRQSHFNYDTPVEALMYALMGLGATTLVVCVFLIGYGLLKGTRPEIGDGLKFGAAWGLILGAVGTFVTAGVMSSGLLGGLGHWVGGIHSDAHGVPFFGWSRTGGDLRVAHFFATHLMQSLPLIGFCADRWLPTHARQLVWAGAAVLVSLVVLTFIQAVMGQPLFPATPA